MTRRPTSADNVRIRGGRKVTVWNCGMKYARCSYEGCATSFLVKFKDLVLIEPEEEQTVIKTKPLARPAMDALDEEFLGDLK